MEAAKTRKKEIGGRRKPCSSSYFAIILKEITGEREEKNVTLALLPFVDDGSFLSAAWACRKWTIAMAIERRYRDLKADRREIDPRGLGI